MDPIRQARQEVHNELDQMYGRSFFADFLQDAPDDGPLERVMVTKVHYFVTQLLTRYRRELGFKKLVLDRLQRETLLETLLKPPYRLKILPQSLSYKRKEKMYELRAIIEELDADLHQMLLEHITHTVLNNYRLCNSLQIRDGDEYSSLKYVQSIFPDLVQIPIVYIGDFRNEQEARADGFQTI